MARRVIKPVIPLCFIGTVFVFTWILGEDPVFQILSGGLMLGAFHGYRLYHLPLEHQGKNCVWNRLRHYYRAESGYSGALPEGVFVLDYPDEHIGPHIET